jgi:hypothetical protein
VGSEDHQNQHGIGSGSEPPRISSVTLNRVLYAQVGCRVRLCDYPQVEGPGLRYSCRMCLTLLGQQDILETFNDSHLKLK